MLYDGAKKKLWSSTRQGVDMLFDKEQLVEAAELISEPVP